MTGYAGFAYGTAPYAGRTLVVAPAPEAPVVSLGGLVLVDLSTTAVLAPISGEPPVVQHIVTPTVPAPILVGGRPT